MLIRRSDDEHPLKRDASGRHVFGGVPFHKGIVPSGSKVPTHRIFEIDLEDPSLPFGSDRLKSLPLYYPLKYGIGGPWMQYRVVSEAEIEIVAISDAEPDPEERAYVKASQFPEVRFNVLPRLLEGDKLTYDVATLGGSLEEGANEPCRNPLCVTVGSSDQCDLLATIPPIPVEGHDDIWWEFEGAYMFFHFWYCRGCDTIITNNRCS